MSFKISRFLSLLLNFIAGAFFLFLGLIGVILPWAPKIRQSTATFFLENTLILSLFGLGCALVGLSIIFYTFLNTKRRYLFIRTGKNSIEVSQNILQQYLENYWKKSFPKAYVPFEVTIKRQSIQVIAELPSMELHNQKKYLEKVKTDFEELFTNVLGCSYEVHLFASFKSDPV